MNFDYPPEAETFRAEFRGWLDANLPDELRGVGTTMEVEADSPELERWRTWNRALADARYAAIAWPEEFGGRGAGVLEQVVVSRPVTLDRHQVVAVARRQFVAGEPEIDLRPGRDEQRHRHAVVAPDAGDRGRRLVVALGAKRVADASHPRLQIARPVGAADDDAGARQDLLARQR